VHLANPADSGIIGGFEGVLSINQVKINKPAAVDILRNTSNLMLNNLGASTIADAATVLPNIRIQESRYQFTAGTSSMTFTHAKKDAIAAGLIEADTPVYAYLFSSLFPDRANIYHNTEAYVSVYESQGNSGGMYIFNFAFW
jgi:hypothetical protein